MSGFQVGQRVATMRGFQAVGGPGVAHFGTVVKVTDPWEMGKASEMSVLVRHDDGTSAYYVGWMLRPVVDGLVTFQEHDYNYGEDVSDPADDADVDDSAYEEEMSRSIAQHEREAQRDDYEYHGVGSDRTAYDLSH